MKTDRYRILPQHSAAERRAIFESLKAEGLKSPLILDEHGEIIDGHLRRDICEELNLDWRVAAIVEKGLTDDQKKAMAVTLNLARRSTSPTTEQRREYAKTMLLANPEQSDGCIAAVVGLDDTTVCKYRQELLKLQKIKPVTHTVGKDGRRRKVSSEKRKASNSKTDTNLHNEDEAFAPAALRLNGATASTNGVFCLPLSPRSSSKNPSQVNVVSPAPEKIEPPIHEQESVLRLLVKINAVLAIAVTMPVVAEEFEGVEAEIAVTNKLLAQIRRAA